MRINGDTRLIAHIGYPTHSFKAPLIYNPYFESKKINVVVVPFSCQIGGLKALVESLKVVRNFVGALVTMPHKVAVMDLLDEISPAAEISGSCNAIKLVDGRLVGDMFDGTGFVRALINKGVSLRGASALVVGAGGVGCAIAASLADAGIKLLRLHDVDPSKIRDLTKRIRRRHALLEIVTGCEPRDMDIVVNATPMGMSVDDPLPLDVNRISIGCIVGDVVMRVDETPFLKAAKARGARVQVGIDMLFEQIPAYLDFFNLPTTDASNLRRLARISN